MKNLIVLSAILCLCLFQASAQNATKTFSKSFNSEKKETVNLDLPGEIDLKIWDNPTIKIEITVVLASGNSSMLNELANVGRYNLTSKVDTEKLLIQAPNMQKQVKVKGELLKETLTFVVFVPKTMQVVMK